MRSILFFDDFLALRQRNLVRRFHQPTWMPEHLFVDTNPNTSTGWSSVVPAPGGGYYLYYGVLTGLDTPETRRRWLTCLARSEDALRWEKMAFDPPREPGLPQVVLAEPAGIGHIYHDAAETDPQRRYKMTSRVASERASSGHHAILLHSGDGLAWTADLDHPFFDGRSDTMLHLLRNPRTGKLQVSVRKAFNDRRIFMAECDTLSTAHDTEQVFHPDPLDPPNMQLYGMPWFQYGDMFVGFLWRYYIHDHDRSTSYMAGYVETELVYSYDGTHWNRTHHTFMSRLAPGTFGGASIYGTDMLQRDDELLVYARATRLDHGEVSELIGHIPAVSQIDTSQPWDGVLPGRLRKDGFVSLAHDASRGEVGEMITDWLFFRSPELSLNVSAPAGEVRVQVTDMKYNPVPGYRFEDCEPIRGDHLAARPRWREHADLSAAIEQLRENKSHAGWGRVAVTLDNAELFAIHSDFGLLRYAGEPEGSDYL